MVAAAEVVLAPLTVLRFIVPGAFCCCISPRGLRSCCSCSSPQLSSSASAARSATSRCESSVPVDELGVSAALSSGGSGAATLVSRCALDLAGICGGSMAVVSRSSPSSSSSDVAVSLVGDATMTGGGPRLVGTAGTQDGFAGSGGGRETPLATEGGKHSRTVWKIWSGLINVHHARTVSTRGPYTILNVMKRRGKKTENGRRDSVV